MALIKKFEYDNEFEDQEPLRKFGAKILKSSTLISSDEVKIIGPAGESINSSDSYSSSFNDDAATFVDQPSPTVDELESPQQEIPSQVDESQVRESVMNELKAHFDDLLGAITNLKEARDSVLKSSETQLAELSLMIAEKIIAKKIETDPTLINSVIEDTFDKISGSDRIIFKINPADAEAVSDFQSTIESRLVGVEKITIQQGGCIIETDLGFVDVTIQEKLNLITQTFKKLKSVL